MSSSNEIVSFLFLTHLYQICKRLALSIQRRGGVANFNKVGHVTLITIPLGTIYLSLANACHDPPAYQIWSVCLHSFHRYRKRGRPTNLDFKVAIFLNVKWLENNGRLIERRTCFIEWRPFQWLWMQGRRSHRSWGGHDPPLFEAKGDGGHNLGIIHISYCSYHAFTLTSTLCRLFWRVAHHAVNYFPIGGL